jgi:hypothetical protein
MPIHIRRTTYGLGTLSAAEEALARRALEYSFAQTKEIMAFNILRSGILDCDANYLAPAVKVSLPVAVAMGAAAAMITNPKVSRRSLLLGSTRARCPD